MTSSGSRRILKEQQEFNGEERRILDLLDRGLSRDFPNPQRIRCPNSAVLRGIALHQVPLAETDRWLDHFSSCSPCFQEFTRYRKQSRDQRRRTQIWLAGAAVVLFAIVGWFWTRPRPSLQTTATVILDLREYSVARGQNPAETGRPPLEIPRSAKQVVIDLPIGSKEGTYELALLTGTGQEISLATGTASLEDHVVILRADIDIGRVGPASYLLGVRRPGLEWSRYPARVH
jgi:hypothetical protein